MPPLGIFNLGKQPPPEPRRPIEVQYGTAEDEQRWKRLLFAKYLVLTHRLGGDDLAPAPQEQP